MSLAEGLLGRHVGRRAEDLAFERHGLIARLAFGQSEIHDVRLPGGVHHDVVWLQVAMDHASVMGVVERGGDFGA